MVSPKGGSVRQHVTRILVLPSAEMPKHDPYRQTLEAHSTDAAALFDDIRYRLPAGLTAELHGDVVTITAPQDTPCTISTWAPRGPLLWPTQAANRRRRRARR